LELAASESARPSGSLTLPAISAVFTVTYVAEMLGEDEDWLHELSIDMFPEDSCLRVYGVGKDGVTAFTDYGIECLKQHHHRRKDRRQSPTSRQSLRCSPHADAASLPMRTSARRRPRSLAVYRLPLRLLLHRLPGVRAIP
jgi:hypothetical protein